MNTTAAAIEAHVSVDTIRTWCRRGVVAAVKQAGRWIIDSASLAHRIALGALKVRKPATKPVVFSIETMTAIGGNRWTKAGHDRVYINNWQRFIGLEVDYYNSGNICGATLDGELISNSEAGRILGAVQKVYFDTADNKVHIQWGYGNPRHFDRAELADTIFTGIRAAIAAL